MPKEPPVNSCVTLRNGVSAPTLAETIASWEANCAQLTEQIAAIQARADAEKGPLEARREAYEKMIAGARELLPFEGDDTSVVVPLAPSAAHGDVHRGRLPAHEAAKTWTATMNGIIQTRCRVTYEELRDEIMKTHLAKKLAQTDKSFYGAIGKLAGQGKVVRHNGWIYSATAYAQHKKDVAAGRTVDEKAPNTNATHQSPFGDAIKAYLDCRSDGAPSTEIIKELKKTPEFFDTIERHKSHAYNVLARLVDQGELVKGGGRYFRAPNKSAGAAQ